MKIHQANPFIKLTLAMAFCLAAIGRAPVERLKPIQTPILFVAVAILFVSILATFKNFKQSFVPHSVIAIALVFLGEWVVSHLGSFGFALAIGSTMIWIGICYSIIAVGIYFREWMAREK